MSAALRPDFLKPQDKVAIIAPAGWVDYSKVLPAIELIKSWGLEVYAGDFLGGRYFQFSGEDQQRYVDFSRALEDDSVKAVFCARGGYGSVRLFPWLEPLLQHNLSPKWLIGYSDITALHACINSRLGWQSVHGPMPGAYTPGNVLHEKSWSLLHDVLFGSMTPYPAAPHPLNRQGHSIAPLTGGNISVLYGLNATPYMPDTEGTVLFLEEVGEHMYHLDRMMMNLKLSGILANINGLIVGGMTDMKDGAGEFGKSSYEIIREHVEEYRYPVLFGFPAGHDPLNYPLVMGANVSLEVRQGGAEVSFSI